MTANGWPVLWVKDTFTSRARTEQLLKPELENTLTPADYEKAVKFLPNIYRGFTVVRTTSQQTASTILIADLQKHQTTSLGVGAAAVWAYGRFYRKPRWSRTRTMVFCVLGGLSGGLLAGFMRQRAHSRFLQSLDDCDGFIEAISNVERKLGTLDTSKEV